MKGQRERLDDAANELATLRELVALRQRVAELEAAAQEWPYGPVRRGHEAEDVRALGLKVLCSTEFVARLFERIKELDGALVRIVAHPHGCAFCDSGVLRKRVDGAPPFHADNCAFHIARQLIDPLPTWKLGPVLVPRGLPIPRWLAIVAAIVATVFGIAAAILWLLAGGGLR
jgi:hypothetical protein